MEPREDFVKDTDRLLQAKKDWCVGKISQYQLDVMLAAFLKKWNPEKKAKDEIQTRLYRHVSQREEKDQAIQASCLELKQ